MTFTFGALKSLFRATFICAAIALPTLLDYEETEFYSYDFIQREVKVAQNDLYWLALNIYHEARNQHFFGKLAVGIVTLNRVHSPRYEDTIEKVVKEHKQFSWYHTKKKHAPKDMAAWKDCLRIAKLILTRSSEIDIMKHHLKSVTHYHATYVRPKWSKSYQRVIQIGDHIFYRQKK
jgi:spore germination cell wall hydrolase CwlJ-like protein